MLMSIVVVVEVVVAFLSLVQVVCYSWLVLLFKIVCC